MRHHRWLLVALVFALCVPATRAHAVPDWKLPTTDGETVRFSEVLEQGPVLMSFWALWCAPCLKELPHVDAIAGEFADEITVLAINADSQRSLPRVRGYLKSKGLTLTVPLDTAGEVRRKLHVGDRIPFVVLYDAEGNEVYRHLGYSEGDELVLREKIEALLREGGTE